MTASAAEEEQPGKMLVCSHCPKEFRYNSERIRHEMSHSPGFQCEVCSKKFSFVSALRRHQKQHERTGSVKCEDCNRKFRDEILLKRHIKYAHKGTFTCSKCSTQFSSDQALKNHMKCHKPLSERRFKCSFDGCAKSFNFSHHLKHHELTHTNDKQHFCSVCGKGFIQSHHLKTHLKTHDPAEWLYCEVSGCKKKFSTEYARKRHIATHKIKPDSGISSDSSSCDPFASANDFQKESILCASCGEHINEADYEKHLVKCGDALDTLNSIDSSATNALRRDFRQVLLEVTRKNNAVDVQSDDDLDVDLIKLDSWSLTDAEHENRLAAVKSTPIFDKDIGECRTAVGGCIMGPEHCVCIEKLKPVDNYDFTLTDNSYYITPNENNRLELTNENRVDRGSKSIAYIKTNNTTICEGCDCASTCNIQPTSCGFNIVSNNNNNPNIECGVDGVIKIKDTFDVDIPIKPEFKDRFGSIPIGTCRDVIGNCIARGSDGCLCARMMMDDQQSIAQEIDDITPKPKTEN